MPMRQLRSCDFCGDEAAGVYEVVPPELSPTEAEQRRLVLCESCVGTLERTLEPLLARLGIDRGSTEQSANTGPAGSEPAATSPGAAEPASPADSELPEELDAELSGDRRSLPSEDSGGAPEATDHTLSPGESTTAGGADRLDDGTGSISGPADEFAGETEEADQDSEESVREAEDAVRDASPPAASGGGSHSGSEPAETASGGGSHSGSEPAETASGGGSHSGSETTETGSGGEDPEAATTESAGGSVDGAPSPTDPGTGDEPEDFRTVMRLLGNREFPVDRGEIVELAASAYELEEAHVERILAHAVDRGLIEDDGELLRRE